LTTLPMLGLAVLLVHLTLGGLSLAAARGVNRLRSVRLWGWGLILYAAGVLFINLDRVLPYRPAHLAGHLLIAGAAIPLVQGLLVNTGRLVRKRWTRAGLAATGLVLIANTLFSADPRALNMIASSPFAIALFVYGGVTLWRHPLPAARDTCRLMAAGMLACCALWSARIAIPLATGAPENTQTFIDLFSIAQILCSVIGMLCLFWIEVLKMEDRLTSMAYGDSLTGLPNRRAVVMRFDEQASRARRTNRPFALMLFDIDFFKKVNDTYGHQTGDAVLRHLAATLTAAKRQEDLLGRVGGEEFVMLLYDTGRPDARTMAERMRELIARSAVTHEGKDIAVTISGGVAEFPADGDCWDTLFGKADERLYRSKAEGRNRITADG